MNFKGKYTIIRKDKSGNVLEKKSKYNKITSVGRNIVLNLFKNASTSNFKQMIGYKPLDLSTYQITPLLKNPKNNQYVKTLEYSTNDQYYDYYTNFQFERNDEKWDVKSSLFLDPTFKLDGIEYKFPTKNRTASIGLFQQNYPTYYGKRIDYTRYDSHLTNDGKNLKLNVDKVLNYNNNIAFTWIGCDDGNYSSSDERGQFLSNNVHNIDFFLVRCKQRILTRKNKQTIPLWNGMTEQLENKGITLNKPKVKFRYSYSGLHSKNIMVFHRLYSYNNSNTWNQLTSDDFSISENNMTIYFDKSTFDHGDDINTIDQFMVFYNVYYLDDQLQNGICGMYLNYQMLNDVQSKTSDYLNDRMLFGNGSFSYDGFETIDGYVAFPWYGRPIKLNQLNSSNIHRGYDFFRQGKTLLYITSQYKDNVSQRFYSFYPYVSQRPTNFVFFMHFNNDTNSLSMKNFVFLIPQLRTTTPRVFLFGKDTTEQEKIKDQIFRLDAIECDSETTKKDINDNDVSLITWKTYIDYDIGNDYPIKQLGLACGKDELEETSYGWKYIKPIKKEQCNELFSKIALDQPISKNSQQSLEVIYELVVQ